MEINKAGLDLVKYYEGCYLKAYKCPAGVVTIGYGHTGSDVKMGDEITYEQASRLLEMDMLEFELAVQKCVKVPVNKNQFSALVSLAFNIGAGALGASTLLRMLNSRDYEGAAQQFKRWNKARVNGKLTVLEGLVKRRKAEEDLFRRGMEEIKKPVSKACSCKNDSIKDKIASLKKRIDIIEKRLSKATLNI